MGAEVNCWGVRLSPCTNCERRTGYLSRSGFPEGRYCSFACGERMRKKQEAARLTEHRGLPMGYSFDDRAIALRTEIRRLRRLVGKGAG